MWVLQGDNVANFFLNDYGCGYLHSWPRKLVKYLGMRCGYYKATMLQSVV